MPYLAVGALILLLVVWARGRPALRARGLRLLSGAAAVAAFAGAAFAGLRDAWAPAVVLLVLGIWLATSARRNGPAPPRVRTDRMTLEEARSILGVEEDATEAEIRGAYTRLMRLVHPDAGGATGLAVQLNAARDRLLKG